MKTVVITGATRGIGRSLLEHYASTGFKVIGIYKESEDLAKEIENRYENVSFYKADMAKKREIIKFVRDLNINEVDILINNAGIYIGGGVYKMSVDQWTQIMNVNLTSKFLLSKLLLPLLSKSKKGKIINISSRFGFWGNADPDSLGYNITCAGINMLSLAMQKELFNSNVKVGCYIPTVTNTDRFKHAFSEDEKKCIYEKGILADTNETVDLIVKYIDELEAEGIGIDRRVDSLNLNAMSVVRM